MLATDGGFARFDGGPSGQDGDAGCWQVDEPTWEMIAGSNAGEEVVWTVDALDTSTTPATVRRSIDSTLGISLRDVRGAIFY